MRLLVTGAAGGIGRVLVQHLLRHDHAVTALVDEPTEALPGEVNTHVGDCCDPGAVDAAMTGVDAVVHLAAVPAPIGAAEHVFANNTQATFAVLEAAGRAGVGRAVVASSISALGLVWGQEGLRPAYVPIDEAHPLLPEDPYALSKQVDECTGAMMNRRWGMTVAALRFPFVGHADRLRNRVEQLRADPGTGAKELWAYLHTEDAAAALRLAVDRHFTGFHVVNVVAPETLAEVETHELLARYHPDVPLRRELPGRTTTYTTDRAETLLGFRTSHRWVEDT